MRLTKSEFCDGIELCKKMFNEESEIGNALGGVCVEWKPAEWINNYLDLLIELSDYEYAGDYITWFCFETDYGSRADMCKVEDMEFGRTWTINSPEILYDFLVEYE